MKNCILFSISVLFILSINLSPIYAQSDGYWDPTFNAYSGLSQPVKRTTNGTISFIIPYTSNTYLIGGTFTTFGGYACNKLALLDSNFQFIDTFSLTGLSAITGINDAKVLPNGQIIIAGSFQYPNYSYPSTGLNLCRLNSNGAIDTLFHNAQFSTSGSIQKIAIQSDGKIVLVGSFITATNSSRYVARFNSDGSLDNTFTAPVNVISSGVVNDCQIQPDGKIVIGGVFVQVDNINSNYIARLNANGSLDPSFSIGTGFDNHVVDLFLDTSGILVAGKFSSYNGTNISGLVRLNFDGSKDTSFVNNLGTGFYSGSANVNLISDIEVQPDGKIIVDGVYQNFNSLNNRFMRLNNDGTIDPVVLSKEIYIADASDILYLSDGRIVLVGNTGSNLDHSRKQYVLTETTDAFVVLNNDGTLDRNYHYKIGPGGSNNSFSLVKAIVETPDNKIILGGEFITYNKEEFYGITKINYDGSLDTSFNCPYKGRFDRIMNTSDSCLIIAGRFVHESNPGTLIFLAKIKLDGSVDPSFSIPAIPNTVTSMDMYSDGRIVVAGDFANLIRINPNGTIDNTLVTQSNNGIIMDVKVINQNELIVVGTFTQWGATLRNDVAVLGPTGTLLATNFGNVNAGNGMERIYIDEVNGFIYLVGFNNNGIFKYNFSGANFTDYNDACNAGTHLKFLPDGKILLRACPTYDGYTGHAIVRTNNDGSIDLSFDRSAPISFGWAFEILSMGSIISTQWTDTSTYFHPTTLLKLYYDQPAQAPFMVSGLAYKDMNGDNVFQSSVDLPIQHDIIEKNGIISGSTNYSGNYTVYSSDTISIIEPVSNILYHTPNPVNRTIDFSSNPISINADFAYQPIPGMNDLELSSLLVHPIRVVQDFEVVFNVENLGTTTLTPTLIVIKDTTNIFLTSTPAYSGILNDTMTIPLSALAPNQSTTVTVSLYSPNPGYSIGDSVMIAGRLMFPGTDQTPVNNKDTIITTVVASYDPNYKEVSDTYIPFATVNSNTTLEYTIHFQNTGQSYAEDIYIKDYISPLLDLSTIEILCSSDTMNLEIDPVNPQEISFVFPDIYLPDSTTDEPGSHGFVSYRIKLNSPQISINSVIDNTAYIYFDFNLPIVTNTALTVFSEALIGYDEIIHEESRGLLVPNPATDHLQIITNGSEIDEISIYDQTGRLVQSDKGNGSQKQEITFNLQTGIYMVVVRNSNSNYQSFKMLVQN